MIEARNITFSYQQRQVLQDVSLVISPGEFVGVIGPNGAGKSTFLKLLINILHPDHGDIRLKNRLIEQYSRSTLAKTLGYVSQSFQTAFNFTAYEVVLMGRHPYLAPFASETSVDREIIRQTMSETEVWELRDRYFSELSGGEQQRVVLASALSQEPEVLLLDEPTTALDIKHQTRFYAILKHLQKEKELTLITVTHDINLAARYCQRLVVMKSGKIVADDVPEKIVTPALIETVYDVPVEVIRHPVDGRPVLMLK